MNAICRQCKHPLATYRHWRYWLCGKFPLPKQINFVTGEHVADPPYMYCRDRNRHGDCQDYDEMPEPLKREPATMYEP